VVDGSITALQCGGRHAASLQCGKGQRPIIFHEVLVGEQIGETIVSFLLIAEQHRNHPTHFVSLPFSKRPVLYHPEKGMQAPNSRLSWNYILKHLLFSAYISLMPLIFINTSGGSFLC
jgi:hypothetical protein